MTIWILAFIAVLNGQTIGGSKPYHTLEECNAAKVELTTGMLQKNVQEAAMACTPLTLGKLL